MRDKDGHVRITRKEAQQQTRDRLRAAANASIVEEGVAAISIRGICGAAGHSQGAFYSNFATKEDLLVDLMEIHIHEEVATLQNLMRRSDKSSIEDTLQTLAGHLAELAAQPQWSLLSIELQLHARRDPAFAQRCNESKASCYRIFAELIEGLTQRHGLRPTLPPLQTGIGLYALWTGLAVQEDIAGAVPREQMLLGFFRAMVGLASPERERTPFVTQGLNHRRRIGCDEQGTPLPGRIDEHRRFHIRFRASEADIDELGHVNNATWVVWIQDASVAHWLAAARPEDRDRFVAVVLRHEVDYRGNMRAGDEAVAATWVDGSPRGARYWRRVEFAGADGKMLVASFSEWALIDRQTGKLSRVSAEIAAPFLKTDQPCERSAHD